MPVVANVADVIEYAAANLRISLVLPSNTTGFAGTRRRPEAWSIAGASAFR
jgi:hypothetical protein